MLRARGCAVLALALALALAFTPTLALTAGGDNDNDDDTLPARVRARTQPVLDRLAQEFNTSISLGLAYSGGSFGLVAGLDSHAPPKPARVDSLYPMGSATKLYTAVAVMQLAEQGIIDLDAPVAEIIDPFLYTTNGSTLESIWGAGSQIGKVTTRQLLGMRSGVSDYDDQKLQEVALNPATFAHDIDPYEWLYTWAPKSFLFPPGEGGAYSSIGYVLLGLTLASATNATAWTDLDQRRIFPSPLREQLKGFTFPLEGPCSSYDGIVNQYAMISSQREAPGYWNTVDVVDIFDGSCLNGWTMGNLAAAPSDAAAALYSIFGESVESRLVSEETLKQMTDFKPLTVGWSVGLEYGLGTMGADYFPGEGIPKNYTYFVGHAGQDYGSGAPFHYYNPGTDIAIALVVNSEYGMNCSFADVSENQYFNSLMQCQVWEAILSAATNGSVSLPCGSGQLPPPYPGSMPAHCASSGGCVGTSGGLDADECFAWKVFHSAMAGTSEWKRCQGAFQDPCGCDGVTCTEGHITSIGLPGVGLSGTLPPHVGNLTRLATLDLSNNTLFGAVPVQLASLSSLTALNLGDNMLSSSLPALDFAQYTAGCDVGGNDFDCPLPAGAASCHLAGRPAPRCDLPPLSPACLAAEAGEQQNPTLRFFESEAAKLSSLLSQAEFPSCVTELAVNHSCHISLNWTATQGFLGKFAAAYKALDPTGEVCLMDMTKKQYIGYYGDCNLDIAQAGAVAVPGACTGQDRINYLQYASRPSQCIKQDRSTGCKYTWSKGSSCASLA